MANLQHRSNLAVPAQWQGVHQLRGVPLTTVSQQTATQRRKDAASKVVKNTWQIARINKRSRGLHRVGNTCFRLSGIQALLHQPKIVQWIFSHNNTEPDGTIKFPCRNLNEVGPSLIAKHLSTVAASSKNKIRLQCCPACQIKQFVRAYWGNNNTDPKRPLDPPRPWTHNHPEMCLLRDLDTELYKLTPGAASNTQQDPTEFQDRILEACLASTDATIPGNGAWLDAFNGLFILELKQTWRCACGALQHLPPGHFSERIGIENLPIEPAGTRDSVSSALARQMRPEVLGQFDCGSCGLWRARTQSTAIDGAPEILRIKLSIVSVERTRANGRAVQRRNNNPVVLDRVLNLSAYQDVVGIPAPLKYKLKGVLCHAGGLGGGHWAATVVDKEGVNSINDHVVQEQANGYLRLNPQDGMQGVVLMYTRMWTKDI